MILGCPKPKDDQHERNMVISLVVAPKRWSYIVSKERFKDGFCYGFMTEYSCDKILTVSEI